MQPRDTHEKGKMKLSQFTDLDEQIVYKRYLTLLSPNLALLLSWAYSFPATLAFISKTKRKKHLWVRLSVCGTPPTHNVK